MIGGVGKTARWRGLLLIPGSGSEHTEEDFLRNARHEVGLVGLITPYLEAEAQRGTPCHSPSQQRQQLGADVLCWCTAQSDRPAKQGHLRELGLAMWSSPCPLGGTGKRV